MKLFDGLKLYDWVPFFSEVAKAIVDIGKIESSRQAILRKKALDIFGKEHAFNKYQQIDPFSFIYALAQKNTVHQKSDVFKRTIEIFNLTVLDPKDTYFPTPPPIGAAFFFFDSEYINKQGEQIDVKVLWNLFEQALTTGELNEVEFNQVLSLKGVRISKLSQVLFLINPQKLCAIDENFLWLPVFETDDNLKIKDSIEKKGLIEYMHIIKVIQRSFPACYFYEINVLSWLLSGDDPFINLTDRYCQISSNLEGSDGADYFDEFVEYNAVWPGDDGKHIGGYGLTKVIDGDIILIRRGTRNLGGVGIIIDNEYQNDGYQAGKGIKILWLNKESRKLDFGLGDWKGFNERATDDTINKFKLKYVDTFEVIDKLIAKQRGIPYLPPTEHKLNNSISMHSHNTILYGPPGTGKTYHTVTKAVQIITGENFDKKYEEAKDIYKSKLLAEQIEFVTFHQNYSYEDFVAGLRPNTENIHLSFKEHKGVFYRISKKAEENWKDFNQYQNGEKFKAPIFEQVLDELLKPLVERDEAIVLQTAARSIDFKLYSINGKNFGLEKSGGSRDHTISLSTLKALYEGKREYNLQGLGVYYYPIVERLKQIAVELKKEVTEVKLLNYVLIIDEINRANISRVFGELITLLEPDKRLGERNVLTLRLPGLPDDERFGVPPNLYIVATMNTADKSIALIDIALRRRFVFEDMYPRPEVIGELVPEAYRTFLISLNNLIIEKKGVDFTIGHAYFIADEGRPFDIIQVFNQKVIPLLNEYFYNQRGNTVWNLLNPLQHSIPGVLFEQDEFIGTKAKLAE